MPAQRAGSLSCTSQTISLTCPADQEHRPPLRVKDNPGLAAGTLVMEHGGLAGAEQRARAVALGVPVTVQQPLLHDTAEVEREFWGPERVASLFPARGWLDQGAQVSAGSDFPVGQFGAMRSVWGLTTRQTVIGVQGPDQAISYDEAVTLHTVAAARLNREEDLRGTLTPGRLADFTVWAQDPAQLPLDTLSDLNPTHTILGGTIVHGPGRTSLSSGEGIDWRLAPEAPRVLVRGLDHPRWEINVHASLLQARPPSSRHVQPGRDILAISARACCEALPSLGRHTRLRASTAAGTGRQSCGTARRR